MIDKTAAAKYEVTWGMQPHMVSAGAQKNFMAFAEPRCCEVGGCDASIQRAVLEAAGGEGDSFRDRSRGDRQG